MFTRVENDSFMGMVNVYVEDILFAGNKEFQYIAISNLWKTFAIGKEGNIQFKYLGLNLHYNNDTILIKQN